jgi:hypothetical protein
MLTREPNEWSAGWEAVDRRSLVGSLLLDCDPFRVPWRVIPVDIDSIDASSRPLWSVAHVLVEVLKVMPPVADGDASGSVIPVVLVVGIEASLPHGAPGSVSGSARLAMCSSCREPQATTRLDPSAEIRAWLDNFIAAFAAAEVQPDSSFASLASFSDNSQHGVDITDFDHWLWTRPSRESKLDPGIADMCPGATEQVSDSRLRQVDVLTHPVEIM